MLCNASLIINKVMYPTILHITKKYPRKSEGILNYYNLFNPQQRQPFALKFPFPSESSACVAWSVCQILIHSRNQYYIRLIRNRCIAHIDRIILKTDCVRLIDILALIVG